MRTQIDKNYLRLVNSSNLLDKHKPDFYDYDNVLVRIPNFEVYSDDVVVEKGEEFSLVKTFIERKTHNAFNLLKADLDRKGVNVRIKEAGRTAEKQAFYWNRAEENHGLSYAENYVARPYASEHGMGTAIDLGLECKFLPKFNNPILKKVVNRLVSPKLFSMMHKIAVKHGFITRYPVKYTLSDKKRKKIIDAKNSNNVTINSNRDLFQKLLVQYNYEPWHETYVGEFNAEFMTVNKLTLEEYVRLVNIYEEYADEVNDDEKCPSLQEFYNLYTLGHEYETRNM